MKNLNEIKEVLSKYDNLIELAKSKVAILENIDPKQYDTARGIQDVEFYDNSVTVTCDNSSRGCYDMTSFSFPLHFLSLSDEDLKDKVEKEKIERVEALIKKEEERKLKEEEVKEQMEIEQYRRLKEKYE